MENQADFARLARSAPVMETSSLHANHDVGTAVGASRPEKRGVDDASDTGRTVNNRDKASPSDEAGPDGASAPTDRPKPAGESDPPTEAGPSNPSDSLEETPLGHLTIIGTGHVFRIEQTIQDAIEAIGPDIVFVELDQGRLQALLHRKRTGQRPTGRGGFVHRRLQRFQEGVAHLYGGEVGSEMIAAVEAAQRIGAKVALIDSPAEETLKKALRQLTLRERLRAVGLLIKAGLQQILPRRSGAKEAMDEEIQKYQDDPQAALDEMQRLFPTIHRVVIHDRDVVMSNAVRHGLRHGNGVAVVGDGHVEGMLALLHDLDVTAHRLAAVRAGTLPVPQGRVASGDATNVHFGFDVEVGES